MFPNVYALINTTYMVKCSLDAKLKAVGWGWDLPSDSVSPLIALPGAW